jgi:signal transduction histidine kinase
MLSALSSGQICREIAAIIAPEQSGSVSLQSLLKKLGDLLQADYIFVGERVGEGDMVRTLAIYNNGTFLDNIEYSLRGTPCDMVLNGSTRTCVYNGTVQDFFPKDCMLQEMGMVTYIGTALLNSRGEMVGLMSMLHGDSFTDCDIARDIIDMVAQRFASELDALHHQQLLEHTTAQLLKSYSDMEHFTYVAAHDLKAPVINIKTLLQFLESDNAIREDSIDVFQQVGQSVKSLEDTLRSLNEVLLVRNSETKEWKQHLFMDEIEKLKQSAARIIKDSGATICTDFSEAPEIWYPKAQLQSILYNLVSNAIRFRHPGRAPKITLKTEYSNKNIRLKVTDNGLGIDLKLHGSKMFGLFRRFHRHGSGKGLGLYVVKSIVESNEGSITLESEVNKGTTFILTLKGQ